MLSVVRVQRSFCVTPGFVKSLDGMTKKIKAKKTVADIRKLKGFLEESNADGSLKGKINRTARMDENFNTWLGDFQQKNKKYPKIIDLSRFADAEGQLKRDSNLRKDEVEMLHEFQKRKYDRENAEANEDTPDYFSGSPDFIPNDFKNSELFTKDKFLT